MARLVGGEKFVRADERLAPAGRGELQIVAGGRHRLVRNGLHPGRAQLRAGEDAEHARHRAGRIGRDGADARVRIGRADHDRMRRAGDDGVVGELSGSGEQPQIFLAPERLSDGAEPFTLRHQRLRR